MKASVLFICIASYPMVMIGCNTDDGENVDLVDAGESDVTVEDDAGEGADAGDTDTTGDTGTSQENVVMTLVVQDAYGSLIEGIDVAYEGETKTTGPNGATTLDVPKGGTYHVVTTHEDYHDYHVFGSAGSYDFSYITLVSQMDLYNQVTSQVGVVPDPEKGFIVVSVHDDMNVPTVGTKIEIDVAYEKAFTLQGFTPVETDVVVENGQSFVTFANTEVGTVTPTITPPDGFSCKVFKDGAETMEMEVFPGAISVITFHCQMV